jgi:cytochrome oxidase assembly protein ShyY1
MANKPQGKSWSEIQLAIAALAVTATLGFWNLFSTPDKAQTSAQVTQSFTPPPPPTPTETAQPTATALALRPVKIIFGGKAPQQQVIQVAMAAPPTKKRNGGGGNVDTGGGSASVQPPSTGSSK